MPGVKNLSLAAGFAVLYTNAADQYASGSICKFDDHAAHSQLVREGQDRGVHSLDLASKRIRHLVQWLVLSVPRS